MSKLRVYELAKELGLESKKLLAHLKTLNITVASHQSTLNPLQVDTIKKSLLKKQEAPAPVKPKVLIRRRKKAEPTPEPQATEDNAAASEVSAPQPPSAQPSVQPSVQPPLPQQEVAPPPEPAPIEDKPAAPAATAADQTDKPAASKAVKPAVQATPAPKDSKDKDGKLYGKVAKSKAGSNKTRRSAVINTRDLLRAIETDQESEETQTTSRPRTVYVPSGGLKKRDIRRKKNLQKTRITTAKASHRIIKIDTQISVSNLAKRMSVKAQEIIAKLKESGIDADVNTSLDVDTSSLVASEYSYEIVNQAKTLDDIVASKQGDKQASTSERPPVVTVMGHVDHGKTSILDSIRSTDVAAGESGGITQHIGAYCVEVKNKSITFLDTPGHEAFSAMRIRGAKVTDIVVLVVAADDGVMPQTIESISHAKEADVPIIVALNKIDKPNKNLDRIFSELSERGVQVESWGGEVQCIEVSAKEGIGISALLDAILLQAEVMELQASQASLPRGTVIESYLDQHRGAVATLLVQSGTLRRGNYVATPNGIAKIRMMVDHRGKALTAATISTPVQVSGFSSPPAVGDRFDATSNERDAKEIQAWYTSKKAITTHTTPAASSLEELLAITTTDAVPELSLIIKADTQGSAEAVTGSLQNIKSDRIKNKVVHSGVGAVTESDIVHAVATNAIIVAFNVKSQKDVDEQATRQGVTVKYFTIIYELIDAVRSLMAGLLPPDINEEIIGHAEVRNPISIPRIGIIAGSSVTEGKITRDACLRLLRDAVVIYNGKVSSLKRFKDDVKEVSIGYECGIGIEGCQDIREGDVIEAYLRKESLSSL
ncbi:MAG: translation initiation factor IF-2 [Pseudomonadota bacterium]|nr:translation initiation factor IF-2 [Pseudomonadota bacterium]